MSDLQTPAGSKPELYWFHIDETNTTVKDGEFFIVGGLVLNGQQIMQADLAIDAIRKIYGFQPTDPFKFTTHSKPQHVSRENFALAKEAAICLLEPLGIKMIVYVVLHDIAKNKSTHEATSMALNSLLAHFDLRFLEQHNSKGVVCIDRLDDKFAFKYLQDKHQGGVVFVDGHEQELERIMHYSMTSDGASHLSSLVDIALGAFRYCVNLSNKPDKVEKIEVANRMLRPLSKALWSTVIDGKRVITGYGYLPHPRGGIKVDSYREKYVTLAQDLQGWSS
jgi:hypothetical protein